MAKKASARKGRNRVKRKPCVSPTPDKGTYVQRKYKDCLFRFIFKDKRKLLQLYNALNHMSYQDTNLLTITTLENVIYIGYYNDVSFLICGMICLYEHQGSWNPNMPLRGLLYFARLYSGYIHVGTYNLYGKKLIPLPVPQYVVFYNGMDQHPEREILRLSDSYQFPEGMDRSRLEPALDCNVLMLNINYGKNKELMENCRPLMEYSYFIHCIRQYLSQGDSPEQSVDKAVEQCIKEDVMTDILGAHRKEVVCMFLEDYNAEQYARALRKEGFEDGFAAGGTQLIALQQKLIQANRMDDLIRIINDPEYRDKLLKETEL